LENVGTDVWKTLKSLVAFVREEDLQGRAAEVAYNLLFAIVPLLIFLTALSGFIARASGTEDSMQSITKWLFDSMGSKTAAAIRDPIERVVRSNNSGLLSIGAILSLWGGKNAAAAVMKGLNVALNIDESRPYWKKTSIAIGLTIALGISVTIVSALYIAGEGFAANLTAKIGFGDTWRSIWSVLRWPLIAVILVVAVSVIYWLAPNADGTFRLVTPGAVITVVVWGVATIALGFYFTHFAGYAGGSYGALGGVLAFLFWLYVMSLILLVGAAVNVAWQSQTKSSKLTVPPGTS
jgi:membrane protein